MLALYDKNAPTEVVTDATQSNLGKYPPVQEQRGEKTAISLASRGVSEFKTRYRQLEKVVLAMVWVCERARVVSAGYRL